MKPSSVSGAMLTSSRSRSWSPSKSAQALWAWSVGARPAATSVKLPPAAAVRSVVAHQRGAEREGRVVPDRRQQEVEVAVVVVVRPGDGAQVEVGLVVVLPVRRQHGVGRHQGAGVVAVDHGLAVGPDREVLVAVAVHVAPGEVRRSRGQRAERHVEVRELPLAAAGRAVVAQQDQALLDAGVVDDVVAEHRDVEVAVAVVVGGRGGGHPEVLVLRRHEERVERGHLGEVAEGAAGAGLDDDEPRPRRRWSPSSSVTVRRTM